LSFVGSGLPWLGSSAMATRWLAVCACRKSAPADTRERRRGAFDRARALLERAGAATRCAAKRGRNLPRRLRECFKHVLDAHWRAVNLDRGNALERLRDGRRAREPCEVAGSASASPTEAKVREPERGECRRTPVSE